MNKLVFALSAALLYSCSQAPLEERYSDDDYVVIDPLSMMDLPVNERFRTLKTYMESCWADTLTDPEEGRISYYLMSFHDSSDLQVVRKMMLEQQNGNPSLLQQLEEHLDEEAILQSDGNLSYKARNQMHRREIIRSWLNQPYRDSLFLEQAILQLADADDPVALQYTLWYVLTLKSKMEDYSPNEIALFQRILTPKVGTPRTQSNMDKLRDIVGGD